jgi:hypothetical protein
MVWYNPWTWGSDDDQASFKPLPAGATDPLTPEQQAQLDAQRQAEIDARPVPGTQTTSRLIGQTDPKWNEMATAQLERDNRGLPAIQQGQYLTLRNEGTTYEGLSNQNPYQKGFDPYVAAGGYDERNYMYGRTPGGADLAANRAIGTGQGAEDFGRNVQHATWQAAQNYANRQAQMGDWSRQNSALVGAESYGNQLAGLERTQGPSAAQAQLQAGNNAAMAGQLALARSGSGFGGNAASAGLAQSNLAGLQAGAANNAAMLRAQEDAAWRQRQAGNFANAAGIQQGLGQQYAGQQQTNLNAYYQNQGQSDAAAMGFAGMGIDAGTQGFQTNLMGQGLAKDIYGQQMQGGIAQEDNILREMAARQGWDLGQQQRQDQKEAGYLQAGANFISNLGR